jgi:hypothetical protein
MAYTAIDDPTLYFSTTIYTGDGQQNRAVTIDGTGMQPDLLWNKSRSLGEQHAIGDSVRGVQRKIGSSNNDAESSASSYTNFSTITSTGFTVATGGVDGAVNQNNATYVNWAWKAGTAFSNDASSTSVGSIDSSGSVSTTAGFSIISWTGTGSNATIAHGLGVQPQIVWVKNRDDTASWNIYTVIGTGAKGLFFNETAALDSDTSYFNSGTSSTTTFPVGTANTANGDGDKMIAYCFANVKGYSKTGSYEGNGNADGPFVYTGFKPAWVMTKSIDTTSNWNIFDNKRSPFNDRDDYIKANAGAAEDTGSSDIQMDFTSQGFKIRGNNDEANGSETFIYMAFAESPFVSSSGVPTTAR